MKPTETLNRESDRNEVELSRDGAGEFAMISGVRVPVTRHVPSNPLDWFTEAQKRSALDVYRRIAQCLPTEGRDYSVSFSFELGARTPKVSFRALTQLGADFIRHLQRTLRTTK